MADGYLDLLGNSLKDTVIHSFPDEAALTAHPGTGEGQIASTVAEGSFWIWTAADAAAAQWVRVSTANDVPGVSIVAGTITDGAPGSFTVQHGFSTPPAVEAVDANGKVLHMEVQHGRGNATVSWEADLSAPVRVTCIGTVTP